MNARAPYVGQPIERIEDLRLLRGKGCYVDDIHLPRMLHAVVLRSPVAHGRLRGVDASAALRIPGVISVITAVDFGDSVPTIPLRLQPMASIDPYRQPVIARDKVRYVGEPVAVVIAESAAIGEDALEAIVLDIEALPVVADRQASSRDETLLFEAAGTNRAVTFTGSRGDADAAFRNAAYVRKEHFAVQRQTAMTMETRGFVADWDAARNHMTVYGAAKVVFFNRRTVAQLLGLPQQAVDLIENDVGGGFGARGEFYPEDVLIPFASRHVGRPVKWVEDRREHLLAMNHCRQVDGELEIACERDGTIIGIRGVLWVDIGAYARSNGLTAPRNVAQFLTGPYRVPNIRIEARVQLTNKMGTGTYRAPGRFEGTFMCERLVDIAGRELGIDPAEMRRRNLVAAADMPYAMATIDPGDLYANTDTDSGDYPEVFERCLAEFGWAGRQHLQGALVDGRYHGLGLGCFIEGGAAGPKEHARMALEADGSIAVYVGSTSVGQGLETVLTQIAADALGVAMDRIRLYHGSTPYVSDGFGSYHSRSTVMGGSAIVLVAEKLKRAMRAAAAERLGCWADEVVLADGLATAPSGRSVPWSELAADQLDIEDFFDNHHRHTYAYGTAAAHVAVDPRTGAVELLDYLVVEDVGRIVNPLTLHGQVIGATVQGLGTVFLEEHVYDADGQLLTGSLADYLIPGATDFPNIRGIALELHPSPTNPLGVKGAGEGGIICVAGVVANAVAAALAPLGVAPNALPLSPSRLWHLIAGHGKG